MKLTNGKIVPYEYKCTRPMLPPNATNPVMDSRQMENWLNEMDDDGWEFVGYAQKVWSGLHQDWWIFRKPCKKTKKSLEY